ncbi:iron-containing alcohol dehydrogenase [Wolbachia endosymbiont of Pentidionis agamae]|uniref:iron-containing alcohol dehydrogenase n=1 Tax=Wolbachia endosymbiont of Pentidionis agamae TaxID=3110435 RepID=UPI002FCF549D
MHTLKKILHQGVYNSNQIKKFPIKEIITDHNVINNIYEICKQYGSQIFLIADQDTVKFLNQNLLKNISYFIISSTSIASLEIVNLIRKKTKDSNLIVAFGSGTINDICKYASYLEKKDYILFPTAASMNGYTSSNASILDNRYKRSFNAHLPKAIYIDINILANAPLRLTLSGFADFICRSTVQADWLLSHLLFDTEYTELPFILTNQLEKRLLAEYKKLVKRDVEVILLLMEALLVSGLGMVIAKGSHSASQGEHMISHAMEMVTKDYSSLHGEKIAVTSNTMAKLQEKILTMEKLLIKETNVHIEDVIEYFPDKEFKEIFESKKITKEKADFLNKILDKNWDSIKNKISKIVLPAQNLQEIFKDLSIPYIPEHLGWSQEEYYKISNLAFTTRDRFTFLDLAHCI